MTGITEFYETLIRWTFALIDYGVAGILLSFVFRVDEHMNIKTPFDSNSRFKKTSLYVFTALFIVIACPYFSVYIQSILISVISSAIWKTIPVFFAVSSFIAFWISKFVFGRSWKLPIVKNSLLVFVLSLFLIML